MPVSAAQDQPHLHVTEEGAGHRADKYLTQMNSFYSVNKLQYWYYSSHLADEETGAQRS